MTDLISREAAIAKFTAMLPDTEKHRKIDLYAVIDYLRTLPAVGVKSLEWLEIRPGQYYEARAIGILYSVRVGSDGVARWQAGHMGTWYDAENVVAAKAAAQADYAARISSALTATPTGKEVMPDDPQNPRFDTSPGVTAGADTVTPAQDVAGISDVGAERFEKADWYWRVADPYDCGYSPEEAVNRGMLGRFCVCEIASSYTGPTRYGFIAPVLDPESDDEEFVHFDTHEEAMAAAKDRAAIARMKEAGECPMT